jgi:hypothetical protein
MVLPWYVIEKTEARLSIFLVAVIVGEFVLLTQAGLSLQFGQPPEAGVLARNGYQLPVWNPEASAVPKAPQAGWSARTLLPNTMLDSTGPGRSPCCPLDRTSPTVIEADVSRSASGYNAAPFRLPLWRRSRLVSGGRRGTWRNRPRSCLGTPQSNSRSEMLVNSRNPRDPLLGSTLLLCKI